MAASGKKGKTKWKPVETSQIINPSVTRKLTTSSWADESVNDLDDTYDFGGRKTDLKVALPTAPRAARGPENDANIPKEPPFQAYLSNLSYEVTEDDLHTFFADLRVKSVRLPRDDRGNNRAKGFGYVEFEDRNSLIEALSMPDTTCKNRRMRIEVAENGDQGRGGRGGPRDRGPNEPDRTMGDWRSGPRTTENDSSADRDGYRSGPRREFGGGDRGASSMYDRDRRPGGGFRDRDDGFRSREGGFRDSRGGGGGFRDDRGGGGFRDDRGPGGGSFRDDRDRGYDRGDRASSGGGGGGTWRREPDREREREREQQPPPSDRRDEPKTRTRLNLQPRSRPLEENNSVDGSEVSSVSSSGGGGSGGPGSTTSSSSAASIFGGARPVDTAAREREIEERLAKQRESAPALAPAATAASAPAREESRLANNHTGGGGDCRRDAPSDAPSPLEPAPPPKENVWQRRSQHTSPPQVNNGRISPHEDGDSHKHRDSSPNNEPRKYQPPRKSAHDDRKRDERGPVRGEGRGGGGGYPRGGGPRNPEIRQQQPTPVKPRLVNSNNGNLPASSIPVKPSNRSFPRPVLPKLTWTPAWMGGGDKSFMANMNKPINLTQKPHYPVQLPSRSFSQPQSIWGLWNAVESAGLMTNNSSTKEPKRENSEESIRMPKLQEHQAPNFVGSNKFAFLEDSESAAD